MASASVTNSFVDMTTALASEANQNFDDLTDFLNTNVVHKDGQVAMTGSLTLPSAPTNSLHAATKAYVDKYRTRYEQNLPGAGNFVTGDTIATLTITDPGYDINVWVAGSVLANAQTLAFWEIQCYTDGVKTGGIIIPHASLGTNQTYAVLGRVTAHTTGTNCTILVKVARSSGSGNFDVAANTGANNLLTAYYTAT